MGRRLVLLTGAAVLAGGVGFGVWVAVAANPVQQASTAETVTSSTTATDRCGQYTTVPASFDPATATDAQVESLGLSPWPGPHDGPGFQVWVNAIRHVRKLCTASGPSQTVAPNPGNPSPPAYLPPAGHTDSASTSESPAIKVNPASDSVPTFPTTPGN